MLSEKYEIRTFVDAVKAKTFTEVMDAANLENADLEKSEDPFLSKENLRRMTVLEQEKFIEKRTQVKGEYGRFLRHLRTYMKDDKSLTLFNTHDLANLETIFRNIAIAENPRCGRYIAAITQLAARSPKGAR